MENKTGFFGVSTGNKSFVRLNIAWYFWMICVPGSLWLLYVLGDTIARGTLSISDGGTLIGAILILQLGWIAPKQLAKQVEKQELLKK